MFIETDFKEVKVIKTTLGEKAINASYCFDTNFYMMVYDAVFFCDKKRVAAEFAVNTTRNRA